MCLLTPNTYYKIPYYYANYFFYFIYLSLGNLLMPLQENYFLGSRDGVNFFNLVAKSLAFLVYLCKKAYNYYSMQHYSRPLDSNKIVEDFLNITLQFDYSRDTKLKRIISKIVDGELGVSKFNVQSQTLSKKEMRDATYRDDNKRWDLRERIIRELFTKKRLDEDEKIALNKGGALPNAKVVSGKNAFILIGLPASGKSGIATKIAEDYGAVIIDSDFAKRKLPEFKDHLYGASIVHEESSQITFGFQNNPRKIQSLYELCIEKGHNIIIPRIGQNPVSLIELASVLTQKNGYKVHLVLVSLPKREATIRAVYRFAKTGRYVPLGLIFDGYGNDPSHCYYYLRCKHDKLFRSFGVVSTSEDPRKHTDVKGASPVLKYKFKNVILQLP